VTAQVLESVRQDPGTNQSLQAQESDPHFQVAPPLLVTPPLSLDDDGSSAQAQETTTMDPAADASLDNDQLLRQHSVTFLFQEQVLSVL
jgi:hypothetical protein